MLSEEVFATVFDALSDTRPPAPLNCEGRAAGDALAPYAGRYGARAAILDVSEAGPCLNLKAFPTAEGVTGAPQLETSLHPCDERGVFSTVMPGGSHPMLQRFFAFDGEGRPQFLNFRGRAYPRLEEGGGA